MHTTGCLFFSSFFSCLFFFKHIFCSFFAFHLIVQFPLFHFVILRFSVFFFSRFCFCFCFVFLFIFTPSPRCYAIQGVSSEEDEMAALESKLEAADLPNEASKVAMRDLARLKRMQASQPEYTVRLSRLPFVYLFPFFVSLPFFFFFFFFSCLCCSYSFWCFCSCSCSSALFLAKSFPVNLLFLLSRPRIRPRFSMGRISRL